MEQRTYDIVVFGATGFTGRLAAEYLAEHGPRDLRWALAGRNRAKLQPIKNEISAAFPSLKHEIGLIEADSSDAVSLAAMAASTRVVMTTVGPYIRYGEPLVKACVEAGTDYVDITGEPEFVRNVQTRYHEEAKAKGLRIVSCCGFDSIPHDLGAFYTLRALPDDRPIRMEGFVHANGGISGGTWNSALDAMGNARAFQKQLKALPRVNEARKVSSTKARIRYSRRLGSWVVPLPTIDPEVVKRSARSLKAYGPEFRYGHYMRLRHLHQVVVGTVGVGMVFALAQLKPTRDLLRKFRTSGEGPTQEQRDNGWFSVTFVAEVDGKHVVTKVSGGEPGYAETSKMVSESALCLAFDRDKLNLTGVVTTAEAMGDALIARLTSAGMQFEVLENEFGARPVPNRPAAHAS